MGEKITLLFNGGTIPTKSKDSYINPNNMPEDKGIILGGTIKTVTSDYYYNPSTYKKAYDDSDFHSSIEANIYNYMLNAANEVSVHNMAIQLHGGRTSKNCAYFTSELFRRMGIDMPQSTSMVTQVENQLLSVGFKINNNINDLKPGYTVFTKRNTHVYTFMGWVNPGQHDYAYIVDNQAVLFSGHVYHVRRIDEPAEDTDTDPMGFFMYSGN